MASFLMFRQQLQVLNEEYDLAIIFALCVLQIVQTVLQTTNTQQPCRSSITETEHRLSMFSFSDRVGKSAISDLTRAIRLTSGDMHRMGPVNWSAKCDAVTDMLSRLKTGFPIHSIADSVARNAVRYFSRAV